MKPSEFWSQIFALPEQARQAEGEAAELRIRADALTAWAKIVLASHREASSSADDGDMVAAMDVLSGLPARPDVRSQAASVVPADDGRSYVEKHGPVALRRKQRSDAGKPRGRKTDESASANPAVVKALAAARVKLAGQIRDLLESERAERGSCEPFTLTALDAAIGVGPERLLDALKLLSLVSWRMQREGDSQPVEVWGTYKQLGNVIITMHPEGWDPDETATELGVRRRDVDLALGAL